MIMIFIFFGVPSGQRASVGPELEQVCNKSVLLSADTGNDRPLTYPSCKFALFVVSGSFLNQLALVSGSGKVM